MHGDLSKFPPIFKEKIVFKSHLIKSNHRVLKQNKVATYEHQFCTWLQHYCFDNQNVY